MELLGTVLDDLPDLARGRGSSLGADKRVDTSAELSERVLNMGALGETSTKEGSVEDNEDPRSALEENSGEEDTAPESDLEGGDNGHGSVIVLLDESTDLVSKSAVDSRSAVRRSTVSFGSRLGRKDGGDHIGAGVGSNVEDRVDRVRDQGEGVLRGEEPNKGHGF